MSTRARLARAERRAQQEEEAALADQPTAEEVERYADGLLRLFEFSRRALAAAAAGEEGPEQYRYPGVRCGHPAHAICPAATWSCDAAALHDYRVRFDNFLANPEIERRIGWPGGRVLIATLEMVHQCELHYHRTRQPLSAAEATPMRRAGAGSVYLARTIPEYVLSLPEDPEMVPAEFPLAIIAGRLAA